MDIPFLSSQRKDWVIDSKILLKTIVNAAAPKKRG